MHAVASAAAAVALLLAPLPSFAELATPLPPPTTQAASEPADAPPTPAALFDEAWRLVDDNYLGARRPFDRGRWAASRRLAASLPPTGGTSSSHAAISQAIASLADPYSRFVPPSAFGELTRYDVSGVGVNLGDDESSPSGLRVLGVVLDGSAATAGVRQGDALVEIDGALLAGLTPFQASTRLAALDRSVGHTLTVAGGGGGGGGGAKPPPRRTLTLPPSSSAPPPARPSPVSATLQPGGVGVIAVSELNGVTARDASSALSRLASAGATSFVLDLRDCPGGLVAAGVELARLFLQPGDTVAYASGRVQAAGGLAASDAARAAARGGDTAASPGGIGGGDAVSAAGGGGGSASPAPFAALRRIAAGAGDGGGLAPSAAPLSVLVNGRTASAAEIVAGALRDNCRAPLVGSKTFGKGLIQSVYELSDGSGLVLTVGTYVRPNGESLDQKGIAPDFRAWPGAERAQRVLDACVRPPPPPTGAAG